MRLRRECPKRRLAVASTVGEARRRQTLFDVTVRTHAFASVWSTATPKRRTLRLAQPRLPQRPRSTPGSHGRWYWRLSAGSSRTRFRLRFWNALCSMIRDGWGRFRTWSDYVQEWLMRTCVTIATSRTAQGSRGCFPWQTDQCAGTGSKLYCLFWACRRYERTASREVAVTLPMPALVGS